jgi:hypothetical protein
MVFGGGSKDAAAVSAPSPQPVVRMPDRRDPAVLDAGRRKRRDLSSRNGRDSTNLTDSGTQPPYSNDVLGR